MEARGAVIHQLPRSSASALSQSWRWSMSTRWSRGHSHQNETSSLDHKLSFLSFASVCFLTGLHKTTSNSNASAFCIAKIHIVQENKMLSLWKHYQKFNHKYLMQLEPEGIKRWWWQKRPSSYAISSFTIFFFWWNVKVFIWFHILF
jgi:hypothetical protein